MDVRVGLSRAQERLDLTAPAADARPDDGDATREWYMLPFDTQRGCLRASVLGSVCASHSCDIHPLQCTVLVC